MKKKEKTNAMRKLDQAHISYEVFVYDKDDVESATAAGNVYKTLILQGVTKKYYVCVTPVHEELDLKKVANEVGEKRVELIPVEEMNQVSGYIRGGCSPIGMKKQFLTIIDQSAINEETIKVSGGKIGVQIELQVSDLQKIMNARLAPITRNK